LESDSYFWALFTFTEYLMGDDYCSNCKAFSSKFGISFMVWALVIIRFTLSPKSLVTIIFLPKYETLISLKPFA
jgi:hypothetical protein